MSKYSAAEAHENRQELHMNMAVYVVPNPISPCESLVKDVWSITESVLEEL